VSRATREVVPVAVPDLSRTTPAVAEAIRQRQEAIRGRAAGDPRARAIAYGELGKILLAARFYSEAEQALLNARALAPDDMRWPYFLGHVHKRTGSLAKSIEAFAEARRLSPDHVATLVWLGEASLARGDVDDAASLFDRASALDARSAAARFGSGRAALLRQDFRAAAEHLEAALTLDPGAESVHYPLAMAYRGVGDDERARTHLALRRRGDIEVPPADPLMVEVDALVESPTAFELRGIRALDKKDWAGAADSFRRGVAMAPGNASLRHRLGTALFMAGDVTVAIEQFSEAVRVSPGFARAHYSLGVLSETSGRQGEAITRYTAAVEHEPGYAEARSRLAHLLRRTGRAVEALAHFERVLAQDPGAAEAAFGYGLTLVRLGRYAEARTRLGDDMTRFTNRKPFALALVRLLAAAPVEGVRDGARALALANELVAGAQTLDVGEALAMALAETGDYQKAASIQRELIAAARAQGGRLDLLERLARNLTLYEHGRPSRQPWVDEPEFTPGGPTG
jgi:tetratricopeptide (TPR) repeat protein